MKLLRDCRGSRHQGAVRRVSERRIESRFASLVADRELISEGERSCPLCVAASLSVRLTDIAVDDRGQAAAAGCAIAVLNGNAGGNARSGNSFVISRASAIILAAPARKLVTNSR